LEVIVQSRFRRERESLLERANQSLAFPIRACESAAAMAEEFAFRKAGTDGAAIDWTKGRRPLRI